MKVLNLHGYRGDPHNCAYSALTACGFTVCTPAVDYDTESPEQLLDRMQEIIAREQIGLLAGTSLGGFFAAVLSVKCDLPVVLVNPCLMPFLHLPRLGYTGDIRPFLPLFGTLSKLNTDRASCIVGADDEVIDTHDFTERLLHNARFCIVPGGKHSGATLPLEKFFREVL